MSDVEDPYAAMLRELRDPVAAVTAAARTLVAREGLLAGGERSELHQQVLAHARRLEGLVDDVVLYARVLGGAVAMRPVSLLLGPVVAELRQRLGEPDRVHVHVPDGLTVTADPGVLAEVLRRLLRNALVYGPRSSGVRVVAATSDEPSEGGQLGQVTVRVEDDGVGIPADAVERAFSPFGRAVMVGERRSDGPGLGLTVARELAHRLGGELRLRAGGGADSGRPGLVALLVLPA